MEIQEGVVDGGAIQTSSKFKRLKSISAFSLSSSAFSLASSSACSQGALTDFIIPERPEDKRAKVDLRSCADCSMRSRSFVEDPVWMRRSSCSLDRTAARPAWRSIESDDVDDEGSDMTE